eukprot:762822-Hanusia_phi.AAC.15
MDLRQEGRSEPAQGTRGPDPMAVDGSRLGGEQANQVRVRKMADQIFSSPRLSSRRQQTPTVTEDSAHQGFSSSRKTFQ